MKMLEVHAAALDNKVSAYHEFLSRFSKTKKVVYGFVEGKEDPCFYRGFIDYSIPEEWSVELWAAGNKDQVYKIYNEIDWRRFTKKRICFFVDRDLSYLTQEKFARDLNIYVTDGYSIENDIVNRGTCLRILTEVFGYGSTSHDELDEICDLFDSELDKYFIEMIEVMAWILFWRRNNQKPTLCCLDMNSLFSFNLGNLQKKNYPNGKTSLAEYIHSKCKLSYDPRICISSIVTEFKNEGIYKKYTRGKFLLWFLLSFCLSIKKKAKVEVSKSNVIVIVGNRARIPNSLRQFINNTFCSYIEMKCI